MLSKFETIYRHLFSHAVEYKLGPLHSSHCPNAIDYTIAKLLGIEPPYEELGRFMRRVNRVPNLDWVHSEHFETLLKAKLIQSGILTDKTLPT